MAAPYTKLVKEEDEIAEVPDTASISSLSPCAPEPPAPYLRRATVNLPLGKEDVEKKVQEVDEKIREWEQRTATTSRLSSCPEPDLGTEDMGEREQQLLEKERRLKEIEQDLEKREQQLLAKRTDYLKEREKDKKKWNEREQALQEREDALKKREDVIAEAQARENACFCKRMTQRNWAMLLTVVVLGLAWLFFDKKAKAKRKVEIELHQPISGKYVLARSIVADLGVSFFFASHTVFVVGKISKTDVFIFLLGFLFIFFFAAKILVYLHMIM